MRNYALYFLCVFYYYKYAKPKYARTQGKYVHTTDIYNLYGAYLLAPLSKSVNNFSSWWNISVIDSEMDDYIVCLRTKKVVHSDTNKKYLFSENIKINNYLDWPRYWSAALLGAFAWKVRLEVKSLTLNVIDFK